MDIEFKGIILTVEIWIQVELLLFQIALLLMEANCSVTTLSNQHLQVIKLQLDLIFTNTVTATNLSIKDMAFTGSGTLVAQASVDNWAIIQGLR